MSPGEPLSSEQLNAALGRLYDRHCTGDVVSAHKDDEGLGGIATSYEAVLPHLNTNLSIPVLYARGPSPVNATYKDHCGCLETAYVRLGGETVVAPPLPNPSFNPPVLILPMPLSSKGGGSS